MTTKVIGAGLSGGQAAIEDVEVGQQRPDEGPVGRLDDDQRDARDLPLEGGPDDCRRVGVVGDVDRPDVVVDRPSDVDRLDDGPVEARDRDDDPLLAVRRANDEFGVRRPARASSGRTGAG